MRSARSLWAPALGAALLLTTGCAGGGDDRSHTDRGPATASDSPADALGHVHGLGIDPQDGALYAATHFGVLRVGEDGSLTRIADRWQDTMAFTVVGPGHFLGSGHPDLREDLPPHLGLIESTDAARTWSTLSLGGEADFHALDVSGDRLYGYDATSGRLVTTVDRDTWTTLAREPVVDLAADPGDPQRVLSSTQDGELRLRRLGSADPVVLEAPPLVLLEWPRRDLLVGLTASGAVFHSDDAGENWTRAADAPGAPQAFDATGDAWHVATDHGIHRSEDGGNTWTLVVAADH